VNSIFNILTNTGRLATGKINLLEHPLIETFFELKWWKIWRPYTIIMLFFLCHTITVCGYAIMEFGKICSKEEKASFQGKELLQKGLSLYFTVRSLN
jgi:hypothetical protein